MARLRTGITYDKGAAKPYVAMVRYRPGRGKGAVGRKRFEKYEQACAWQSAEQAKVETGSAINPNDRAMTVGYVAADWLAERRDDPRISRGTYESGLSHWRCALAPTFEDMPVVDVTEDAVKRWQVSELKRGIKESTCAIRQTTLSQILDHARRLGVRVPNAAREVESTERLQVEELPEFDVAAALEIIGAFEDRYRIGALLAFGAGLRSGEFRGLRLTDCTRLPNGEAQLHICHATNRYSDGATLPKGRKARVVKISGRLMDRIEDHCAEFGTGPNGEIMSNRGQAVTDRVWRLAWLSAVEASGVDVPKGQAVHMFRHIYAQRAVEAGVDIADVAGNLGHAQNATTWRYYTRTNARSAAASDIALDALDQADARKARTERHLRAV